MPIPIPTRRTLVVRQALEPLPRATLRARAQACGWTANRRSTDARVSAVMALSLLAQALPPARQAPQRPATLAAAQ
jgi:hypothetical protein